LKKKHIKRSINLKNRKKKRSNTAGLAKLGQPALAHL